MNLAIQLVAMLGLLPILVAVGLLSVAAVRAPLPTLRLVRIAQRQRA